MSSINEGSGIDLKTFSIEAEIERYKIVPPINYQILVRLFIQGGSTASGLLDWPLSYEEEQSFTSCVGLVVGKSELAYSDRPKHECELGEWIVFPRNSATKVILLGKVCFYMSDDVPLGKLPNPTMCSK